MSTMKKMVMVAMMHHSVMKTLEDSRRNHVKSNSASQPSEFTPRELEFQVLTGKYGKKVLATYKTRKGAEKYAEKVNGHVVAHWF